MKHPFGCNTLTTVWWREQLEENGITAMHTYRDQLTRIASVWWTAIRDCTQFRLESPSLSEEGLAKVVSAFTFVDRPMSSTYGKIIVQSIRSFDIVVGT